MEQQTSTSNQSQITEQLCPVGEVQTGRFGHATYSSHTRGLSDEARPQRCVFHGSYIRTPQEIPKVPVSEHNIRAPMSPIWSIHRATSFHEVVEASYSDPSIIRNKDCDLPRRYSGYASGDQNHQEMIKIFHMLTGLLENLWFIIKQEKCSSFPTQELVFLGAQLNSKEMTLAVPPEKCQNLQTE